MAKEAVHKESTTQVKTVEADEFATLLKQSFKPRTERAATEVDNAVSTLVQEALKDTSVIKSDVLDTIEEMIARIDQKLTAQMNEILTRRSSRRSRAPGAASTTSSSIRRPTPISRSAS